MKCAPQQLHTKTLTVSPISYLKKQHQHLVVHFEHIEAIFKFSPSLTICLIHQWILSDLHEKYISNWNSVTISTALSPIHIVFSPFLIQIIVTSQATYSYSWPHNLFYIQEWGSRWRVLGSEPTAFTLRPEPFLIFASTEFKILCFPGFTGTYYNA